MPRIRTIKPEFPQSESMGRVSREARLAFVLLWTLSDDAGRLRGNSRMLASLLYPYDDDAPNLIDKWLIELEREGCIIRYKIESQSYLQICNWLIHQKIDKPSQSKIPECIESSRILANSLESSPLDQGEDQVKEGEGRGKGKEKERELAKPKGIACPDDVSESVWQDWLKLRKAKRAPVSETVLKEARRESEKANMLFEDFLKEWCVRGSQGLKAEWLNNGKQRQTFGAASADAIYEKNMEAARRAKIRLFGENHEAE